MKRRTTTLIGLGVLLAIGGIVAWQWEPLLQAYVFRNVLILTTSLPACDRVEVFHLGGKAFSANEAGRPKPGEGFPIRAYDSAEANILGRTTLNGADAEALAMIWRTQTFDPGFQALCHFPSYGFRFYSGRKLTFETSVCFHCSNFYVTDLFGSNWWGFDSESPKAQQLLRRLQEIFPDSIPKPKFRRASPVLRPPQAETAAQRFTLPVPRTAEGKSPLDRRLRSGPTSIQITGRICA